MLEGNTLTSMYFVVQDQDTKFFLASGDHWVRSPRHARPFPTEETAGRSANPARGEVVIKVEATFVLEPVAEYA